MRLYFFSCGATNHVAPFGTSHLVPQLLKELLSMNILDKINDLYIKGWITEEEYEELYNKYAANTEKKTE